MIFIFVAAQAATIVSAELIALDRRIQAAMVTNDISTLRRTMADDFKFRHSDGTVERKTDVLKAAALKPRYYLRRDVLHAEAEVYGSFALIFGTLDVASGAYGADAHESEAVCYALNYVHVFRKRQRRWQLLSHRTTAITQPERPCSVAS